jgi:hypothetical protein
MGLDHLKKPNPKKPLDQKKIARILGTESSEPARVDLVSQALEGKGSPPTEAEEPKVRFACGHACKTAWLASGDCPNCFGKKSKERKRKAREAWEAKKKPLNVPGRLPDGSQFHVTFSAEAGTWSGHLVVPSMPDGKVGLFAESESGVFKLLTKLDQMYREAAGGGDA